MSMDDKAQKERAEYWASVKDMAREAHEAEKRGEDPNDYIHESVDGSHYVIYTYASLAVLQESSSEDAAFDEMGDDALVGCKSYAEVVARLAYHAMSVDVHHELNELRENEPEEDA